MAATGLRVNLRPVIERIDYYKLYYRQNPDGPDGEADDLKEAIMGKAMYPQRLRHEELENTEDVEADSFPHQKIRVT